MYLYLLGIEFPTPSGLVSKCTWTSGVRRRYIPYLVPLLLYLLLILQGDTVQTDQALTPLFPFIPHIFVAMFQISYKPHQESTPPEIAGQGQQDHGASWEQKTGMHTWPEKRGVGEGDGESPDDPESTRRQE